MFDFFCNVFSSETAIGALVAILISYIYYRLQDRDTKIQKRNDLIFRLISIMYSLILEYPKIKTSHDQARFQMAIGDMRELCSHLLSLPLHQEEINLITDSLYKSIPVFSKNNPYVIEDTVQLTSLLKRLEEKFLPKNSDVERIIKAISLNSLEEWSRL